MLTRRAALQGGTATVAAIAGAGAVAARAAVATDPIVALRAERGQILAEWDTLPDEVHRSPENNQREDALCEALTAAEVAILEAEHVSYLGLLIQFEQAVEWLYNGKPYAGQEVLKRLFKTLPTRVEHLAGRAQS